MTVFANFVRCELDAGISAAATSFDVLHASPYNRPPDPAGGIGRLIIRDSLRDPTAFEIITYTGITVVDSETTTLTGVSRGTEGISARSWSAGAVVAQDVTAADLQLLSLQNQPLVVIGGSVDNSVRRHESRGQLVWSNTDHDGDVVIVAAAPDGSVASIDEDGVLRMIGADGVELWEADFATTMPANVALAVSQAGNVYYGYSTTVGCYNSAGSSQWTYTTGGVVRGLDVDHSDNVFVAAETDGLIRLTPDGDEVWILGGFTGAAVAVSVCPDRNAVVVGDASDIFVFDYGAQQLATFGGVSQNIQAVSGDRIAIGLAATNEVALVDWTGASDWSVSLGVSQPTSVAASDIGLVAYVSTAAPNQISVVDLDGNAVGDLRDYTSPVNSISIPRITPSHAVVYQDGEFKLRVPSYENLADLPFKHDTIIMRQSDVPETPPAQHCFLYFEGTNLVVKWDDGTTDTIATKGP